MAIYVGHQGFELEWKLWGGGLVATPVFFALLLTTLLPHSSKSRRSTSPEMIKIVKGCTDTTNQHLPFEMPDCTPIKRG